jgi:hypothetical protein
MTAPMADTYRFDGFVVDTRTACLRREGATVPLRPKSFDVLLYLVRNRGRLVSKEELFDNVWANVIVTDNSLSNASRKFGRPSATTSRRWSRPSPNAVMSSHPPLLRPTANNWALL